MNCQCVINLCHSKLVKCKICRDLHRIDCEHIDYYFVEPTEDTLRKYTICELCYNSCPDNSDSFELARYIERHGKLP